MTNGKNIIRFWSFFAVALAVALLAITVVHNWHRIFPEGRVSQVYVRASAVEGIEASFVEDYRLNDTITLDVTLLEAKDSAAWQWLCEELGITSLDVFPPEIKALFMRPQAFEMLYIEPDTTIMQLENEHLSEVDSLPTIELHDVCAFNRYERMACVFHLCDENTMAVIVHKKTKELK